jgi:hypothetical protein
MFTIAASAKALDVVARRQTATSADRSN